LNGELLPEDIQEKLKLSRNAKILLLIGGLFTIANGLSGTFVNVYLWKSNQDFAKIGIFNFLHYLFIPISFIVGGWLSKKRNGTLSLRIGIVFHCIFYLSILVLGTRSAQYVVLLGILLGTAAGFYWLSSNTLTFDLTSRYNRDTFNSFNGMVMSLSGMLPPLASGYIIIAFANSTGYRIVFGLSLALFAGIALISLMLRTEKSDKPFHLLGAYRDSGECWKYIMLAEILFGIRNGVLMFLINLLIYISTENEASIGKVSLVGSMISIVVFFILEKVLKPRLRVRFFSIGAVMMFVSVCIMVWKIDYLTLLLFTIINTIFSPFFTVTFDSSTFNCIEKGDHKDLRIEYIVLREIALNIGRLLGTLAFILVAGRWKDLSVLRIFLLILGSTQLYLLLFLKKLDFDVDVIKNG